MSQFAGMGGHHSARPGTEEWLTPPYVLDALGGADSFDLDPCAPVDRPWPTAKHHLTIRDNGLISRWFGRVWLNPPYSSKKIIKWLARLGEHGIGTALIFARTETEAFHRHVWERATALLFLEGRLNFHHVDGARCNANAGAPSVLCAYGHNDADVLCHSGLSGHFVPLQLPRSVIVAALTTTWREVILALMARQSGPVALADLYRALSIHPKTRTNRNFEAKIRQELQRGPFRRVDRGKWEMKHG